MSECSERTIGPGSRPVAVVGPTATGKSDLALALAERLDGEVVNADAVALYRGMDVGTAKLSVAQRRSVPHHLLDVLDITETASVAAYQREARAIVEDVLRRGRTPVLAGGSGLYVRAVLDDLQFPGTDAAVRARLEHELASAGSAALHARLRTVDPVAATAIPPGNGRRVVRALEVVEITGQPFSATLPVTCPARWGTVQLGLDLDPAALDARIDARVERMFVAGLVEEVVDLAGRGLRDGRTASRALGYQQILGALAAGEDPASAAEPTARATRRFVRRQRSWFRRDERITWLDAAHPDLLGAALGQLA